MTSARFRLKDKLVIFDPRPARRRGTIPFQNHPLVGRRRIYLSADDKEIVALDRRTLATEWQVKVEKLSALREWDEQTLALRALGRAGALDTTTGRVLWTMDTLMGNHCWADMFLLFEQDDQTLVGVNVRTGEKRLILTAPEQVSWSILGGDMLVCRFQEGTDIGSTGLVRGLDLRTGDVLWERDLLSEVRFEHGVVCTSVYLTPGSLAGWFVMTAGTSTFGCAVEDGRILWKANVWVEHAWPLVEGGRIPVLTREEFVVLDEASGEVRCRRKHGIPAILHARPGSLVSEDVFGTVTEEGQVMLFDMHTAELLSWAQHRVSFQGTAAADGRFLVVASDGKLWVYEPLGP